MQAVTYGPFLQQSVKEFCEEFPDRRATLEALIKKGTVIVEQKGVNHESNSKKRN